MKIKFLIFLLIFACCSIVFAEQIGQIKFATEATYPPFEYVDADGKIKGFDIDIANALCNEIKAHCIFSNQAFNSLIPSLRIGKFDAVISALGITAERKRKVAFTNSYYQPSGAFVGRVSKKYMIKDMLDKKIGVQQSSTFETYLQDKYGSKVSLKTYASIQDAFLDLTAGRVDAVMADTPIAQIWLKENNHGQQYEIIEKPIMDINYFGSGFGIAVKQDDVKLLDALNKALATIQTNGTYQKIKSQYFGNE